MMFDPHDPLHPHPQPDKISPTLSQRIEITSVTLPPPNVVRLSVFQPCILWLGISCVPLLSGCLEARRSFLVDQSSSQVEPHSDVTSDHIYDGLLELPTDAHSTKPNQSHDANVSSITLSANSEHMFMVMTSW